jgi:hypothetical protein
VLPILGFYPSIRKGIADQRIQSVATNNEPGLKGLGTRSGQQSPGSANFQSTDEGW